MDVLTLLLGTVLGFVPSVIGSYYMHKMRQREDLKLFISNVYASLVLLNKIIGLNPVGAKIPYPVYFTNYGIDKYLIQCDAQKESFKKYFNKYPIYDVIDVIRKIEKYLPWFDAMHNPGNGFIATHIQKIEASHFFICHFPEHITKLNPLRY